MCARAKNILYLHVGLCDVVRDVLEGIRRYADIVGWDVFPRKAVGMDPDEVGRLVEIVQPAGIIFSAADTALPKACRRIPVVDFETYGELGDTAAPLLEYDDEKIAHLATRELWPCKCASYGYVRYPASSGWNARRERYFKEEIVRWGGKAGESFKPDRMFARPPVVLDRSRLVLALRKWIAQMAKPCGVFAANDQMAELVCLACAREGLVVARDVFLVGVDNERSRCERAVPSLTSIALDREGAGFFAASALSDIINGRTRGCMTRLSPLGIIRRGSTGHPHAVSSRVLDAVRTIREAATSGLRVDDVVKVMRCSRRLAEKVFRSSTGMSILEGIRHVRFDSAKVLLREGDSGITAIANRCGYASMTTFCREFKALVGVQPTVWRQRAKLGIK